MCIFQSLSTPTPPTHLTPVTHPQYNNHKLLSVPWCVSLLGHIETAGLSKISPSPQREESADVPPQTEQARAVPRARVSVYMDTLKHSSSDYELISANACAASASAQFESSAQTFTTRGPERQGKPRGEKRGRRRNNNVCLNNGCPDCSSWGLAHGEIYIPGKRFLQMPRTYKHIKQSEWRGISLRFPSEGFCWNSSVLVLIISLRKHGELDGERRSRDERGSRVFGEGAPGEAVSLRLPTAPFRRGSEVRGWGGEKGPWLAHTFPQHSSAFLARLSQKRASVCLR